MKNCKNLLLVLLCSGCLLALNTLIQADEINSQPRLTASISTANDDFKLFGITHQQSFQFHNLKEIHNEINLSINDKSGLQKANLNVRLLDDKPLDILTLSTSNGESHPLLAKEGTTSSETEIVSNSKDLRYDEVRYYAQTLVPKDIKPNASLDEQFLLDDLNISNGIYLIVKHSVSKAYQIEKMDVLAIENAFSDANLVDNEFSDNDLTKISRNYLNDLKQLDLFSEGDALNKLAYNKLTVTNNLSPNQLFYGTLETKLDTFTADKDEKSIQLGSKSLTRILEANDSFAVSYDSTTSRAMVESYVIPSTYPNYQMNKIFSYDEFDPEPLIEKSSYDDAIIEKAISGKNYYDQSYVPRIKKFVKHKLYVKHSAIEDEFKTAQLDANNQSKDVFELNQDANDKLTFKSKSELPNTGFQSFEFLTFVGISSASLIISYQFIKHQRKGE